MMAAAGSPKTGGSGGNAGSSGQPLPPMPSSAQQQQQQQNYQNAPAPFSFADFAQAHQAQQAAAAAAGAGAGSAPNSAGAGGAGSFFSHQAMLAASMAAAASAGGDGNPKSSQQQQQQGGPSMYGNHFPQGAGQYSTNGQHPQQYGQFGFQGMPNSGAGAAGSGYNGLPQMPQPQQQQGGQQSMNSSQGSASATSGGAGGFMGNNGGYPGMGGLSALAGIPQNHLSSASNNNNGGMGGSPSSSSTGGLPGAGVGPFGLPALPSDEAVVAQHFGHQPTNLDTSSGGSGGVGKGRSRGKGRSGISRSNSITNNQQQQQQQMQHQYIPYANSPQQQRGQFPPQNQPMMPPPQPQHHHQSRNSENVDAEGESMMDDAQLAAALAAAEGRDDLGTSYAGPASGRRALPKRRSASAAQNANASLAAMENNDDGSSSVFPGGDFDASNLDFSASLAALAAAGTSADLGGGGGGSQSTGLGAKRGPASDLSSTISAEDEEWVAEASDDSYGRPSSSRKKARKSYGGGSGNKAPKRTLESQLHQGEAGSMSYYASPGGSGSGLPPLSGAATSGTSAPGVKKRENRPAAPGSGNIVCDYVDPSTGIKCSTRFRRPYDQARHMETVHKLSNGGGGAEGPGGQAQPPKWSCNQCKKSFSRKDALIRHGRISNHQTS